MKIFNYSDYIKSIHCIKRNTIYRLEEESTKYNLNIAKEDKIHDKLIKYILKDKKETIKLINQFLNPKEKVTEENIEKYTNSYINKKYNSKEADIVYKLINKDIYFLIEHQSTIDHNMPYRILNDCIDIIQEWKREKRNKKITEYPIVVPIVVYTGKTKWKVPKNYKDQQIKITTYEKYRIDLAYNLIDANIYSIEELLQKSTMFSYGLLIEKSRDKQSLVKNIRQIIQKENDKQRLEKLSNIIIYLLGGILEEDGQEELLENINKKVGEKDMESLVKRIVEEEKRQRKKLERKAKKEIINKIRLEISKSNEDDKIIEKINNIINKAITTN